MHKDGHDILSFFFLYDGKEMNLPVLALPRAGQAWGFFPVEEDLVQEGQTSVFL